jgi:hypothetical protein
MVPVGMSHQKIEDAWLLQRQKPPAQGLSVMLNAFPEDVPAADMQLPDFVFGILSIFEDEYFDFHNRPPDFLKRALALQLFSHQ